MVQQMPQELLGGRDALFGLSGVPAGGGPR